MRNLWSYVIIFCGHFPDGALHFTEEELEDETRAEWYLRQILGAANFKGGPLLHIMSGNLGFQIEHHLFPDLPSNRYAEISVKVRALCEKYDIPYTTGPLHRQYGQALRTIIKLSLPNGMTTSRPARAADTARSTAGARPTPSGRPGVPSSAAGRAAASSARHDARRPVRLRPRAARWTGSWVTQCALSRICGVLRASRSAGRSRSSARRTRSAATPSTCRRCTSACAEELRRCAGADPTGSWSRPPGFEFVRPAREDARPAPDVPAELAALAATDAELSGVNGPCRSLNARARHRFCRCLDHWARAQ